MPPRWAKIGGLVALILLIVVVVLHLTGLHPH
jgi:hypothetical protein